MDTLILFDIDGTLITTNELHMKSFNVAIREVYGIDASIREIDHHGMVDTGIFLRLCAIHGLDHSLVREKLPEAMDTMVQYFKKNVTPSEVHMLPGVRRTLDLLKQKNIGVGLLTGNAKEVARAKLQQIHISRSFRFGGFGDESSIRKELVPIAIKRAEELFGAPFEKEKVFILGDTPMDIDAARQNGIRSIGVASGDFTEDQLKECGADHVLPDLTDPAKLDVILTPKI